LVDTILRGAISPFKMGSLAPYGIFAVVHFVQSRRVPTWIGATARVLLHPSMYCASDRFSMRRAVQTAAVSNRLWCCAWWFRSWDAIPRP